MAGAPWPTAERPSPTEIERDMDRTRADLAATLAALRRRVAPRRLVEKGSDMVDATLRKMKDKLDAAVRQHARWIGVAGLAAAGVGWFLIAQGRRARRRGAPPRDIESLLRPERKPPGWLVGPMPTTSERRSATAPAAEPIGAATEQASLDETRVEPNAGGASHMVGDHSLVIGALAVAAAAAVAMLLPPSRHQQRTLGPRDGARAGGTPRRGTQEAEPGDDAAATTALRAGDRAAAYRGV
jgi:Protein of unknown function (DUF3618)